MKKTNEIKKVIIIGAGVAGLSAGIYGQKNGFQTEIYEKNPVNGGLCMSWSRQGHLIDGCVHWMTGTNKDTELYKMWMDTKAFEPKDVIYSDNFGTVEYNGKKCTFWTDLDKLEKELIEISPKDKRLIRKTKKLIHRFYYMPLPMDRPMNTMNIFRIMKVGISMIPYLPSFLYATKKSQASYAKKFKSEELRYFLSKIVPGDGNLYSALFAFGTAAFGNGGVIRGGSSHIVKNMEEEYKRLGGIIHNNREVEHFLTKGSKVVGIKLKNGEQATADYFVTSCDAYEVTRKLLRNSKKDRHITKRFVRLDKYPTPSCLYASYAIEVNKLKELNITSTYEFPCAPLNVGRKIEESLKIREYSYDETFIKDGKVTTTVLIHQNDKDFYYWEKLRKDLSLYTSTKNRIGEEIKERIETRFPSLKGDIQLLDVTTPITYKRYVNAHRGAYMPWSYTKDGRQLMHNCSVKGLNNLIFSGQWTIMPGGLPIALMSGKFAIQILMKKEHRSVMLEKDK